MIFETVRGAEWTQCDIYNLPLSLFQSVLVRIHCDHSSVLLMYFPLHLPSVFLSLEITTLHHFWVVMTDVTAIQPARSESPVCQFQRLKSETYSVFMLWVSKATQENVYEWAKNPLPWIAGMSNTKYKMICKEVSSSGHKQSLTLTQWRSYISTLTYE